MANAHATKVLTNINETIGPIPVREGPGQRFAGIQYGTGGLGTIVLEARILDSDTEWVIIGLTPAAGGATVLNLAAAGLAWANISYCHDVRVRKSVAGAGPVTAALSVT